jgi:hypothetical protein
MKKTLLVLGMAVFSLLTQAQVQTPAPSPAASVSTTVGLTDIKIDYSRPKGKGRKIFGDAASGAVVPFGSIWRTGANSGTKISFSDTVKVEGTTVPKGEYLIFSWPGAAEWTISFYKDLSLGGNTNGYDKANEIVNFKVRPEKLTEKVETFTINISDLSADNKTANIQLAWENTSVKFGIAVDYDKKVTESIKKNTMVDPYNYFQSAVYYFENGKDLNQALEWVNKAADGMNSPFWVLYQKARIQKALGDKQGALASSNASLEKSKAAKNRDYEKMNDDLIKSLK